MIYVFPRICQLKCLPDFDISLKSCQSPNFSDRFSGAAAYNHFPTKNVSFFQDPKLDQSLFDGVLKRGCSIVK